MNSERRMTSRTCLPFAITILALMTSPALAQSVVGGPTKTTNHIGGATTHANPVVPPAKGVTANAARPASAPTVPPAKGVTANAARPTSAPTAPPAKGVTADAARPTSAPTKKK
jgi:hypothetical protein